MHNKPPALLLKKCKKYKIKTTKKVGGKRHYRSVKVLKKLLKLKMNKKKQGLTTRRKRLHTGRKHRIRRNHSFGVEDTEFVRLFLNLPLELQREILINAPRNIRDMTYAAVSKQLRKARTLEKDPRRFNYPDDNTNKRLF